MCNSTPEQGLVDLASLSVVPVHVYLDLVCPWCLIGKKRLDTALSQFTAAGGRVEVSYLPFQLDPDAPAQSRELAPLMAAKFGSADKAAQVMSHVSQIAAADGIEMDFDAAISVNTSDAHRLLFAAGKQSSEVQSALAEKLLEAHLCQGADISQVSVLEQLAQESGLDLDVERYIATGENAESIATLEDEARAGGISSVPTYVFAGRWGVSGAQESDTLVTLLTEVAKTLGEPQAEKGAGGCCGGGCCS